MEVFFYIFVILSASQLSRKNLINSCSKRQVVKGNGNIKIICKAALFINELICFEGFDSSSDSKQPKYLYKLPTLIWPRGYMDMYNVQSIQKLLGSF